MAKPAEIDLILNTKPALDEANKFAPKLEKALTVPVKGNDRIKQMKKDIRDLTGEVSTSAKESREKFEQYGKGVDELAKKAERYEEIQKRLAEIDKDKNYKQAKKDLAQGKVEEKQGFEGAGAKIEDATNRLKPYSDELANLKAESKQLVNEISTGLDALPVKLGQMKQEAEGFVAKSELVTANEEKVSDLVSEVIGEKQEVVQLTAEQATTEQATTGALEQEASAQQGVTDAVSQTSAEADKASGALNELGSSAESAGQSAGELPTELQDAETSADSAADKMADMATSAEGLNDNLQLSGDDSYISGLVERLKELLETKAELEKEGNFGDEYAQVFNDVERTRQAINEYKANLRGVQTEQEKVTTSGSKMGHGTSKAFNSLISVVKSLSKAISQGLSNAIRKAFSGIKGIINGVRSAFSGLSKTINKIKSAFGGMSRDMKSNFKHLLTSLTKYVFGFRSLFFLVRRLRKYIGEGIQNMAQFNDGNNHVNEGITNLLSSLLFLKNAWATAFSPIIQFVQGWLDVLIDRLAAVGNAISRFIGSLLGQGTVFQAVRVDAADYADSLDGVGSSAGGAADKTKKLTDRLAAFDDLNVLGKDNDPDSTGSGGGGGAGEVYTPDPNEMFRLVDVNSEVLDKLKEMWANADFSDLGKNLQDKIVNALTGINWNEIQTTVFKIGKSIVTFFNGMFEDDALWISVGTTISEGINTALMFLYSILSNNQVDIGGGIAKLISNAFNGLDTLTLGLDLDLLAQGIVDNINSFFDNLTLDEGKVSELSQKFTNFFVTIFTGIKWEEVKNALAPIGSAILDGTITALSSSDNPFIQTIGELLAKLKEAIETNDPSIVTSALTTMLTTAFGSIQWKDIFTNLGGFADAFVTGIQESLSSSNNPLLQAIGDMIAGLQEALPTLIPVLSQVFEVLLQIINTILPVITAVLPVITDLMTLLAPILQLIADVITMLSPIITEIVNAVLPVLQSIIEALLPYIQQIIEAILPVILDLLVQLQPVFDAFVSAILPVIVHLLDALMPVIQIILGAISELIGPITAILPPILELIGAILPPLIDLLAPILKLVALIIDLVVSLLSPIFELIAPLIELITNCLSPIFENMGLIGDLIEATIIPIFQYLSSIIQIAVIPILKVLIGIFEFLSSVIGGVGRVIADFVRGAREKIQELGNIFKENINKVITNIEDAINTIINGINSLLEKINANIKFDVPDWVPGIGGQQWGFDLNLLHTVNIPRLAQGAVIPPNKEFMAVLGDQSSGTNIEAPLDTIKQAVAEVVGNNNNEEVIELLQQLIEVVKNKNLVIGDKEIGKANARFTKQQHIIRGTSF